MSKQKPHFAVTTMHTGRERLRGGGWTKWDNFQSAAKHCLLVEKRWRKKKNVADAMKSTRGSDGEGSIEAVK